MDGGETDVDASEADASDTFDASTEPDASETDSDGSADAGSDANYDAGDAAPIMLVGTGPVIPNPAVNYAAPFDVDDAVFTATITAPISKLVLVNVEANGDPHLFPNYGTYYTYWTTSNPIPSEAGGFANTNYDIHTRIENSTDPFPIPVLGLEQALTLDMYVSFAGDPDRTPYYRLYVFGADDELTQIVEFEEVP